MGIRHIQVYDYEDLKREHYYLQGTFSRKLIPIVHDHNFYEIAYVLHGCCRHIVNNRALDMREGEMILLRPGDTHGFSGQSPHTNLLSLSVCKEEMHYFLQAVAQNGLSTCARRNSLHSSGLQPISKTKCAQILNESSR